MTVDEMPLKLMRLIAANPRVSQRELAGEFGVSLGKVNYCLRALVEKGFVRAVPLRSSRNRAGYRYLLTPDGYAQKALLTGRYLRIKMREYHSLRSEIEQLRREASGKGARPAPARGTQA